MLNFKKWLYEDTTASSVAPVPNRLFGPSSISGARFQQPIKNYRKCGLAGCFVKQKHTAEKFFNF